MCGFLCLGVGVLMCTAVGRSSGVWVMESRRCTGLDEGARLPSSTERRLQDTFQERVEFLLQKRTGHSGR